MTFESLLFWSFVLGLGAGALIERAKVGCLLLLPIPLAMIIYVDWWQGQNPDKLRSTSAVDFIFGTLWPSLGALAGLLAGQLMRSFASR